MHIFIILLFSNEITPELMFSSEFKPRSISISISDFFELMTSDSFIKKILYSYNKNFLKKVPGQTNYYEVDEENLFNLNVFFSNVYSFFCVKNSIKNKENFLKTLEEIEELLKKFQEFNKKNQLDIPLEERIKDSLSINFNVEVQNLELLLSFKKNFLNNLKFIIYQESSQDNISSIAEFLKKLGAKNPKNLGFKLPPFFGIYNTIPVQSSYKLSLFIDDNDINFLRKIMKDQFPLSFLDINLFELDSDSFDLTIDPGLYIKNIHEIYIGKIFLNNFDVFYSSLVVQSFVGSLSQEKDLFPFLYKKNISLPNKKEPVNLLYIPFLKKSTENNFLLLYEVVIKKKDNTAMSGFAIVEKDFFNKNSSVDQRQIAFDLLHGKYNLKKRREGYPECILLINTPKGLTFVNGSYNSTTNEYTL